MSNYINLLDIIYLIGSIYITTNDFSPSKTIGGTWEIIDGKFLQSSGNSNKVDSMGGSFNVIGFGIRYITYYSGLCTNDNGNQDNVITLANSDNINDYNKDYITY